MRSMGFYIWFGLTKNLPTLTQLHTASDNHETHLAIDWIIPLQSHSLSWFPHGICIYSLRCILMTVYLHKRRQSGDSIHQIVHVYQLAIAFMSRIFSKHSNRNDGEWDQLKTCRLECLRAFWDVTARSPPRRCYIASIDNAKGFGGFVPWVTVEKRHFSKGLLHYVFVESAITEMKLLFFFHVPLF